MMSLRQVWGVVAMGTSLAVLAACATPESRSSSGGGNLFGQSEKTKEKGAGVLAEADVLPRTHYAAGRLHESQNQLNRAVEQYRATVALDPKHVDAYNGLGVCLTRLGDYKQAEEQFVKAIRIAPDKAHLRNNLAFCYISQRRWADAEAELRNAVELKPDFARARINLALALAQQGRFDGALEAFRAVLNEEDAQFNMGLMYQSVGKYADAGKAFRAAIDRNPRLVAAKERLDKIKPLMERAQRDEAAKAKATAVPTTRPSDAVAKGEKPKGDRSHSATDEKVAADTPSKSKRADLQASPVPRVPSKVEPDVRPAVVGKENSCAAETREEESKPFMVICEGSADLSLPDDLDMQDDLWLERLDPKQASEDAMRVDALDRGEELDPDGVPLAIGPAAPDRSELRALPLSQSVPPNCILIGATLLPDDPFLAFPNR